jgi:aspartyl-tRNA(Asn)/glutamyl-tRNA(Gln) amidotransferase subunit B
MAVAYETVIGLEVHAQLLTQSKLFCRCPTAFGAEPNAHTCPVCLALPGSLPSPNAKAIELALRAAVALGCTVNRTSQFARKNYFYPDLPKGYQISQYELPIGEHGQLEIESEGGLRQIRILRIHMEEDAAKNLHGMGGGAFTVVDFNRGGTPLVEIVSQPDLRSSAEAEDYLKRLREILMFAGVNDGNLEEGSFRCDANVSIKPVGQEKLGTRTELKNINSFRFVRKAIDYEVARQTAVLTGGGTITQETRGYNDATGKTFSMRTKEEAMDYRYFPDPDLPPIVISAEKLAAARRELPVLPGALRERYVATLGLTEADAGVLTGHPALAALFEGTLAALRASLGEKLELAVVGKRVANFVQSELMRHVTFDGLAMKCPVDAHAIAALLAMVESSKINAKMAKSVLAEMIESGKSAADIVAAQGLAQVTDTGAIEQVVREVMAKSPDNVAAYRAGKTTVLGWFVGQVMKATKGQANPQLVNDALKAALEEKP